MINFTKMHGTGNDYIYINAVEDESIIEKVKSRIPELSNRHFGIGGDGVIFICKSDVADFKMRMFNFDGSEAEMCGNGIRCVGKYVYDHKLTDKTSLKIETLAGIKIIDLKINGDKVDSVVVDMNKPILEPNLIPVKSDEEIVKNLNIKALDKDFKFTCVSMGNPHAICFVDDVDNFEVNKYGPILEVDEHFPKKSNIEFVEIIDRNNIKMRVWERGTGETLSCGTGACASTVACILNNYTDDCVNVKVLGGTLKITWDSSDKHIYMNGPASTVFEGVID